MLERQVAFANVLGCHLTWQHVEDLPQQLRWAVQRVVFQRLDEPVPVLADPSPAKDPLPGASYSFRRPLSTRSITCIACGAVAANGA